MTNSPNEEKKLLESLGGESTGRQRPPPARTETTTAPVVTVGIGPFGLPPTQLGSVVRQTERPGIDYHVWQNLSTGECVLRPAQPSPPIGIPPSGPMTHQLLPGSPSPRLVPGMESPSHPQPMGLDEGRRERMSWTGELQEIFEHAVAELGNEATPKPIMKILHERGYHYVTREHVSSHLQKYRLKKSTSESDVQEGSDS